MCSNDLCEIFGGALPSRLLLFCFFPQARLLIYLGCARFHGGRLCELIIAVDLCCENCMHVRDVQRENVILVSNYFLFCPTVLFVFPVRAVVPCKPPTRQVPLDVCAHACQLLGAALFVSSRSPRAPEAWVKLAVAVPDAAIDGLLECLRVAPARARAARTLFYAASAPLPRGTGGQVIESRGGVPVCVGVHELCWVFMF